MSLDKTHTKIEMSCNEMRKEKGGTSIWKALENWKQKTAQEWRRDKEKT